MQGAKCQDTSLNLTYDQKVLLIIAEARQLHETIERQERLILSCDTALKSFEAATYSCQQKISADSALYAEEIHLIELELEQTNKELNKTHTRYTLLKPFTAATLVYILLTFIAR